MKGLNLVFAILLITSLLMASAPPQDSPPSEPVKLIFIHHSTGENWLADGYGDLGRTLGENNYFVSDTNYGWGPNGIGDRTDIPNWTEWFASEETPAYMNALFNESGQHADYTRTLTDPGGENQIIMFKSCFPNSALEGSPNDPPNPEGWLTVGHAKYVYNTILEYFATRPDKLFIVITAPPLSDPTYADNARAFNNWLKNEWLADYEGSNVAVFDFYNVLTDTGGGNTLAYPSGDDHPSAEGSRLATAAFIPALNAAYNRWQAGDTSAPLADEEPASAAETESQPEAPSAPVSSPTLIDNFEGEISRTWNAYHDDPDTSMVCASSSDVAHNGANAMRLDYSISPYQWGTCHLEFDAPQNWRGKEGITFYAYAKQELTSFHVDLFVEGESYVYEGWVEGSNAWQEFVVFWDEFHRVEWEENGGAPFTKPEEVTALAVGFEGGEETLSGTLYIDDLVAGVPGTDVEAPASAPEATESEPEVNRPETNETEPQSSPLPCLGNLALPLGLIGFAFLNRRRKS